MFAGGERHTGSRLVLKLLLVLTLLLYGGESEVRIIYFLAGPQGVDAIASGAGFCSCGLTRSV